MKKTLSVLLILALMLALFAACAAEAPIEPSEPPAPSDTEAPAEEPAEDPQPSDVSDDRLEDAPTPDEPPVTEPEPYTPVDINIAVLKGSTGMGMAKLMADAAEGSAANNYSFALSADATDVMAKVISGEYDIGALPTNAAAVAYAKTQGDVQMLAINTLGVLYLLQQTGVDGSPIRTFEELRGKTIIAFGQAANPEYVLAYLLAQNGLTLGVDVFVDWKATVDEVLATLVTGDYDFVMLPEPNVSVAMSKNSDYTIAMDLSAQWDNVSDGSLVMGCLVVRRSFAEEQPAAVARFLEEYAASIEFVTTDEGAPAVIAAQEIVPAEGIAQKALPNCHIVCITGEEMQKTIDAYYQMLFAANPQAVGGAVPDEGFYYVG